MNDAADLLKIIAGETGRLTPSDRAVIVGAAEELELSNKTAYLANVTVIEYRQQIIALNERIIQLMSELAQQRTPNAANADIWSMGTGWLKVEIGPGGEMAHA